MPQPAQSTPLSPRPPPPPLSPRPPPPTSPPPAKSLHTYGLIFKDLVNPSTRLDRFRLPSHRHYKPTAVPQSKPQSGSGDAPELASGNFQEPEPELAVGEGQLVLYSQMRKMLNLPQNNNARSHILRYGRLSLAFPFGERVWDGLRGDFQLYRYSYQMIGNLFLAWFICPAVFGRDNAQLPVQPGDVVKYPAVFCDWGRKITCTWHACTSSSSIAGCGGCTALA